jgi:hypothetical protein
MSATEKCELCHGELWVCENHPDKPWGDGESQCECGAGMNCTCNPDGDFPPGFVTIATVDPNKVDEWMH